ncbi:hypothetical protein GCM10010912_51140 [Paenibacillus albidus]|uniref:Uncharacterized protein n=1 Tax=Paenibacillus albidus TaxID=2041023 RepID=A0A917CVW6_9BACL|nr:hypothetical protein GCM10010912_51140 [Paenibacillus albidus]
MNREFTNYVPANVVDGIAAPQWFADSADTPDWERQAVSLASAAGIIEVRVVRDHFMNLRELNRL